MLAIGCGRKSATRAGFMAGIYRSASHDPPARFCGGCRRDASYGWTTSCSGIGASTPATRGTNQRSGSRRRQPSSTKGRKGDTARGKRLPRPLGDTATSERLPRPLGGSPSRPQSKFGHPIAAGVCPSANRDDQRPRHAHRDADDRASDDERPCPDIAPETVPKLRPKENADGVRATMGMRALRGRLAGVGSATARTASPLRFRRTRKPHLRIHQI